MKFQMPETLDGLSVEELDKLHAAAWAEYNGILAKDEADITEAELEDLDALEAAQTALKGQIDTIDAADTARSEKLAAAKARAAEAEADADPDADGDGDDTEGDEDEDAGDAGASVDVEDEGADAEAETKEKELVTASASRRKTVRAAASKTPKPADVVPKTPSVVLAAAGPMAGGVVANHEFASLSDAAKTWGENVSKSPAAGAFFSDLRDLRPVMKLSKTHARSGFLKIKKAENEFSTGMDMSVEEQLRIIDEAADERKRFGSEGLARRAVTAAGGWCAPSENLYDFCSYETVSGILDIPTVNIRRGGINFTKGPDYATLAAAWGFLQTEAQAEAGTEKDCYAVECPPFAEVRLDAIGFCVTAGVLTASPGGYPELIRRVLEIGLTAHAHKVNSQVITRIQTLIGAATNYVEIGAATSDILQALEIAALRLRYSLAMAENATVEVVLPIWVKAAIRADLSRRMGVDMLAVGDADITRWLTVRGIRAQFVYDYQNFATGNTGAWTAMPTTLEFMMYPAGAFIKGTSPVIDLDTIYDSVGLSTNTYTAAFFEEGLLVANRCGFGVRYSIDISALTGAVGYPAVGAVEGVAFAPPAA
jgi:hypothetical protein